MKYSIAQLLENNEKITTRKEINVIMALAWPAIVEQIMITMVQYIDTAMVGSLGANATAAIGLTSSTIWLFNGIMAAAAVGFSVQVAQYMGAKRLEEARNVVRQAVLFNLCFGVLMAAIAVALSYPLPRWLGADDAIAADASIYFRIVGYSMPFLLSSTLISSIIRCMGDTKTPMLLNILINVLNVILNTLFIYPTRTVQLWGWEFQMWGAGMGVAGAAIGSAVATGVVSILLLLVLFCKDTPIRIRLRGESYRFSKTCLLAVTKLGVPVALERSTLCVAQIVITLIISSLGTTAIAANHLAVTAEALSYLPANGIAAAATTLVGQAFGAANPRLAIRFGRLSTYLGMAFMTATGVLLYLFAPELISLFTQDADVIQLGTVVLRIEAFAQPLFAASIVASGALRGAGDTKYPFFISLVSMWGVRITLSALIAPHFGLSGVWLAMCIELCVRGAIFLVRLHRGKWLRPNSLQQ